MEGKHYTKIDEQFCQLYKKAMEKITGIYTVSYRGIIHKACNPIQTTLQPFHSMPEFFFFFFFFKGYFLFSSHDPM